VPTGEAIVCYLRLAMKAKDNLESVLDSLNRIREELLSLERAIERIQASRRDGSDESGAVPVKLKIKTLLGLIQPKGAGSDRNNFIVTASGNSRSAFIWCTGTVRCVRFSHW
jgi:hypothetical protein